mgnify:CR=1 FL=1
MEKKRCYIYTRVSTLIQVDGYSLDAQKDRLRKYAQAMDMVVVKEFSDEGKSGKNVQGRPQFQEMMNDITTMKDHVDCVLVFKLSRFGRNAADVLSSLQLMEDYGVHLVCVEDGIDSSKDAGKLIISVLSSVAEIERDNILVQTMEGRRQKVREGKWNGGMAPYGYYIQDGVLKVNEEEAKVVKLIFEKYTHEDMGTLKTAQWLNEHGYTKASKGKNSHSCFTAAFIERVLENPVYMGKMSYGRRTNVKIRGTRNQYHKVKTEDYLLAEGKQEAIVSEELFLEAKEKRKDAQKWEPKSHSLDHEHVLSSLLRCPVCGGPLYGNVSRKRKNGKYYDTFYYSCKHRLEKNGIACTYKTNLNEKKVDAEVEEIIKRVIKEPHFIQSMEGLVQSKADVGALREELKFDQRTLTTILAQKDRLAQDMDSLDVSDKHYDRKRSDMEKRLDAFYDRIEEKEQEIKDLSERIENLEKKSMNLDRVVHYFKKFSKVYDKMSDLEKKKLMHLMIDHIDIFPQKRDDGRLIQGIQFNVPIWYGKEEGLIYGLDKQSHVETVVSLSLKNVDKH